MELDGALGMFSGAVLGCFSGSVVAVSTCKTWDIIRPRLCVSGLDKHLVFMCHLQSHCEALGSFGKLREDRGMTILGLKMLRPRFH